MSWNLVRNSQLAHPGGRLALGFFACQNAESHQLLPISLLPLPSSSHEFPDIAFPVQAMG